MDMQNFGIITGVQCDQVRNINSATTLQDDIQVLILRLCNIVQAKAKVRHHRTRTMPTPDEVQNWYKDWYKYNDTS